MKMWGKHSVWLIPVFLLLIGFMLLWAKNLVDQRQLPSAQWSRSMALPFKEDYRTPFIYKNGAIHLYTGHAKIVTEMTLDQSNYKVKSRKTYRLEHKLVRVLWAKGNRFIYRDAINLYMYNGHETTTLAKGIAQADGDQNTIYYNKNHDVYSYNPLSNKQTKVAHLEGDISTIYVHKGQTLIITDNKSSSMLSFYMINNSTQHIGLINKMVNLNSGFIESGYFIKSGFNYTFFYTFTSAGKNKSDSYSFQVPTKAIQSKFQKPIKSSKVYVYMNTYSKFPFENLSDAKLDVRNGKPVILFSSIGKVNKRSSSLSIYMATQGKKGRWIAQLISTTQAASENPFLIDDKTIGWVDNTGTSLYSLMYSSQQPQVIKQSLAFNSNDFSVSFSNSLLAIPRVLLYLLIGVVYQVPLIIFYFILAFVNITAIEQGRRWVNWTILSLFLLMQIVYHHVNFTAPFKYYSPLYVHFPLSWLVIPIVLLVISIWLTNRVKKGNWTTGFEVIYTMMLFFSMDIFFIGSYIF